MNTVAGDWLNRLRTWFPDRELIMRSQGQVRFIKITGRVQMLVAGAVVTALIAWGLSLAVMGWLQYRAASDRLSLLEREATVAKSEERVGAYRAALARGVVLRPLGDVLYWMPPYCVDDEALQLLADVTRHAIDEATACA